MTDPADQLGTALRDRLADVRPDLDSILAGATRRGRRIRAVRRSGLALGTAAVVAAVGIGVATMGGGASSSAPQYADGGSPAPVTHDGGAVVSSQLPPAAELTPGSVYGLPSGRVAIVRLRPGLTRPTYTPARSIVFVYPNDAPLGDVQYLNQHWPTLSAVPQSLYDAGVNPSGSHVRHAGNDAYNGHNGVSIHLAGWKLVGPVGDDKESLEGPHGEVATVSWRPASEYADWTTNADKGATPGVWTSTLHDGVFVSIQGSPSTPDSVIQALGASLTWD